MSIEYDEYLREHKDNVLKGLMFLSEHMSNVLLDKNNGNGITGLIPIEEELKAQFVEHDSSKYSEEEYSAYDEYFYGKYKTQKILDNFNKAWLHHIHHNPHHWQYYVLIQDDDETICVEMPYNYIIEMICDWWAFSWKKENLFEIFNWYNEHKKHIKLGIKTRKTVENILNKLKAYLSSNKIVF